MKFRICKKENKFFVIQKRKCFIWFDFNTSIFRFEEPFNPPRYKFSSLAKAEVAMKHLPALLIIEKEIKKTAIKKIRERKKEEITIKKMSECYGVYDI